MIESGDCHAHFQAPSSSRWAQLIALVTAAVACAAVALAGVHTHAHATGSLHHEGRRFLQELAEAKGIHVQFVPRSGSPNAPSEIVIDGILLPHQTEAGDLRFDGRLSYVHMHHEYNFTMLHDRGFVTVQDLKSHQIIRNDCLQRDNIPPVHLLTDAINNARVMDRVSGDFPVHCSNESKLVEFFFGGEPYVFCSKPGAALEKVHGEDIEASIELIHDVAQGLPTEESLARPQGKHIDQCDIIDMDGDEADAGASRKLSWNFFKSFGQRTKDAFNALVGNREAVLGNAQCGCTTGLKACLFVHGLGQTVDGPAQSTFADYWGSIQEHTPCCSSVQFMRMDTTNNAWYDDALPRKMCDQALAMTGTNGDPMAMENIALIGHSMGNLIISAAAMKNMCGINRASSKWIALAGPIIGSKSSSEAVSICTDNPDHIWDNGIIKVLKYFGFCPTKASMLSLVHRDDTTTSEALQTHFNQALTVYRERVTSSMCGVNPAGLITPNSALYVGLSIFSRHGTEENDGAVAFGSCGAGLDPAMFQQTWRQGQYYRAAVNHGDASMSNGDGLWGEDRKPIRWFQCQF